MQITLWADTFLSLCLFLVGVSCICVTVGKLLLCPAPSITCFVRKAALLQVTGRVTVKWRPLSTLQSSCLCRHVLCKESCLAAGDGQVLPWNEGHCPPSSPHVSAVTCLLPSCTGNCSMNKGKAPEPAVSSLKTWLETQSSVDS